LSASLPSVIPSSAQFVNRFLALRDGVDSGDASLDLASTSIRDDLNAFGHMGFERGVLGDSFEAISSLINQLDTSLPQISSTVSRTLASYFAITNHVTRDCPTCRSHVERIEIPELMLPIRLAPDLHSANLVDLLRPALRMSEAVEMRCSSCSDEQRFVTVNTRVVPTGEIFMMLITRNIGGGARLNTAITYPNILEHEFLESRYRLVGSAHHTGRDANNGHYYAEVSRGDFWFRADDMRVSEMEAPGITTTSNTVTLLIYERI